MSDEHDSWLQDAFGLDVGGAVQAIKDEAAAAVNAVSSAASAVADGAGAVIDGAVGVVGGVASGVAGAVGLGGGGGGSSPGGSSPGGAAAGDAGGSGSFPLRGSVGRGGQNQPNDVRAVQAALGIAVDGQCGGGTIGAIEAFQRKQGLPKADGRVDPGGATEKALRAGGSPAAPPAPPAAPGTDDGGLLGQLQSGASGLIDGAKALGGEVVAGAEGLLQGAQQLGSGVLGQPAADGDGNAGGSPALADASNPIDSLLGIGVSGQFSSPALALPPDPGFPIGTIAFGQFAGKLAVKFKPTLLSSIKAPKPADVEADIKDICDEIYRNASFKWFGGVTVKGDKKSAGVAASFLKVSTKVGEVTLEIKAFEIGLDIKKIVKASVGSTSANFPVFERDVKGVKYEIFISVGGALEVSPSPAAIATLEAAGGGAVMLAIDVALVAGPPLAAAAVIGVGIFMAGEKAKRDAAILEGAEDARRAAFDYAFTMTGNEAAPVGPRAKAAVEVAKAELSKVAASQKISLEELMREMALANTKNKDLPRIHAQARQQIFAAYFAEVRRHIGAWRKEHSVLAAFTTAADDIAAVEKKVAIVFEKL